MRGLILHFSSSLSCSLQNREPWFHACFLFQCRGSGGGSSAGLNEAA